MLSLSYRWCAGFRRQKDIISDTEFRNKCPLGRSNFVAYCNPLLKYTECRAGDKLLKSPRP